VATFDDAAEAGPGGYGMTPLRGPVAVTGPGGRLGSALVDALGRAAGVTVMPWRRPEYDLDAGDPTGLIERDRPSLVIHCAAWTDVDGCARDPSLAQQRNGGAVETLATACAAYGIGLVVVSTNEVFDGLRVDGLGYVETDPTGPRNAYGRSKLAGEEAARPVFADSVGLWIVRTAWLYGPPGNDFPNRVIAAADRLATGEPLPVVADEHGSPTFTRDLAVAIVELLSTTNGGVFHLVNEGAVSRYDVAARVLAACRPRRALRPISRAEFVRDSDPPPWAVLDGGHASTVAGVNMRGWRAALDDYLSMLC
jgi:dTDP-4-dehydrorhamnose reductase